jgi:hypothetical protein
MKNKPEQATHVAVPINVFQVALSVLEQLPFKQVSSLMIALQECQKQGLTLSPPSPDIDVENNDEIGKTSKED